MVLELDSHTRGDIEKGLGTADGASPLFDVGATRFQLRFITDYWGGTGGGVGADDCRKKLDQSGIFPAAVQPDSCGDQSSVSPVIRPAAIPCWICSGEYGPCCWPFTATCQAGSGGGTGAPVVEAPRPMPGVFIIRPAMATPIPRPIPSPPPPC